MAVERTTVDAGVELWTLIQAEGRSRLTIAPTRGAEVAGWQIRAHDGWREMLYRAADYRPVEGWQGRAPWLFPAVGRNYDPESWQTLQAGGPIPSEGGWLCGNRRLPMPIHGFARSLVGRVLASGEDGQGAWLTCDLRSDDETRSHYPYRFILQVTYRLEAMGWSACVRVEAEAGQEVMPFSLGNHLSLQVPFDGGSFEDYLLVSPGRTDYVLDRFGLLTGERRPLSLREGCRLAEARLHNLVLGDFPAGQAWVELRAPSGQAVRVSQRQPERYGDPEAVHFVFYARPELGFFCPEPWLGRPNSLNTGQGLLHLPPGEHFEWEMRVEWRGPACEEPKPSGGRSTV